MTAHPDTPKQHQSYRAAALANWVEAAAVALVCLCAAVILAGTLALVFIL